MADVAIITEACIDTKDRACVDVCPVQCIYEYNPEQGVLFSEDQPDAGVVNTHQPDADAIGIFADTMLYVNVDECTACTAFWSLDAPIRRVTAPHAVRRAFGSGDSSDVAGLGRRNPISGRGPLSSAADPFIQRPVPWR